MSLLLIILVSSSMCPEGEEYSSVSQTCKPSLRYIKSSSTNKASCPWCILRPDIEEKENEPVDDIDSDSSEQDGVIVPAPAILNIFDLPKYAAVMKKNKTATVTSYKLYQLHAAEGDKLLPKIRQLLQSQGYDDTDNQSVQEKEEREPRLKPVGKSVLVKRVLPHGYVTGEYEYDSKLNTVYKPLVRYHVQKPIEEQERSLLRETEEEQKPKHISDKDLVVLVQKEEIKQDLLNQIQNYLAKNKKQRLRKKKNVNVDLYKIIDGLSKGSFVTLRQQSGQDPFAPGKLPPDIMPDSSSSEEHVHKTVIPSYPFWNYWTHQKNILQDHCPGNLVRVGNMCISKLGHRRSADPPNTRRSHSQHKKRRSIRASRKKHLYGVRK